MAFEKAYCFLLLLSGEDETIEHLFFTCPFASQCWASINFVWDHSLNLQDKFIQANQDYGYSFFH
jgi:hypothetical protein